MLIKDMSPAMNLSLLQGARLGRLACAQGLQPYVTPFSFRYHDNYLYSFATVGRKIEWMRANPLVCVEVDEIISHEEWQTLVIFGRYQELPHTAEFYELRVIAHDLLAVTPCWWDSGYSKTVHLGADRPLQPVYFRVSVDEITGHQGVAHD